ncbi:MAG: hypothetical protein NDJ72_08350, partial [Elusimicrobia bacterium]|nr:hypothetical protein [Elusimicrobiota bacterium]
IDMGALRQRAAAARAASAASGASAAAPAAAPAPEVRPESPEPRLMSGAVDMTPFVRRLEDTGFKTDTVRLLLTKMTVSFAAPDGAANAQWRFIRKILVLPDKLKQPGTNAIKYALNSDEVATVIHEMTHAANTLLASQTAPKGSVAYEHWDAVETIRNDLRASAYFYRYSGFKADEVSGYYMGDAISEVFDAIDEIVFYNTTHAAPPGTDPDMAQGNLLHPTAAALDDQGRAMAANERQVFGRVTVVEDATLEGAVIGWEERPMTKTQMYKNILGLDPPKDRPELLRRLNAADNEWMRDVKRRTLEARRRLAARPR